MVRVAGNFVNDDGLASLEYGARFLGVPDVVTVGWALLGGVYWITNRRDSVASAEKNEQKKEEQS